MEKEANIIHHTYTHTEREEKGCLNKTNKVSFAFPFSFLFIFLLSIASLPSPPPPSILSLHPSFLYPHLLFHAIFSLSVDPKHILTKPTHKHTHSSIDSYYLFCPVPTEHTNKMVLSFRSLFQSESQRQVEAEARNIGLAHSIRDLITGKDRSPPFSQTPTPTSTYSPHTKKATYFPRFSF